VTRLRKAIEQDKLDIPDGFDATAWNGFDVSDAVATIGQMRDELQQHELRRDKANAIAGEMSNYGANIDQRENRIKALQQQITAEQDLISQEQAMIAKLEKERAALVAEIESFVAPDPTPIEMQIAGFQSAMALINTQEAISRKEAELERSEALHRSLDDLHRTLVSEAPRVILSELELPIDGLSVRGQDILVNGHSIDTLSTSEQIRLAVRIARALAGDLKVICVDRYESLSETNRQAFEAEAEGDDFEYFMTMVTSGPIAITK